MPCLVQREEDILLRNELETDERDHDQFKLWYTLDHPPQGEPHTTARLLQVTPLPLLQAGPTARGL